MTIGVHGVAGDLIFVLTGLMFATFGALLRLWRIAPMPAAAIISVLSLFAVPAYWAIGGFDYMIALGWRGKFLPGVLSRVLGGPATNKLFPPVVHLFGGGRGSGVSLLSA